MHLAIRALFLSSLLLLAVGLSSCGGPYPRGGRYSETAGQSAASPAGGGYIVQPGDTLYAVSRQTGVPLRSLIEANGLQPPYELYPGQELMVPDVETYVVQAGDTVYGISRQFGLDASELARQNGIDPPYTITPGQVLVVPSESGAPTTVAVVPQGTAPQGTAPQGQPPETAPGGTVSAEPLPAPQPLTPDGQAPQTEQTPQPEPLGSQPGEPLPAPEPAPQAQPAPTPDPTPDPTPGPAVLPDPPARAGSKFIWPVDGTLLSTYGPKADGLHNDGINIGAPRGAPVKAAENGVVAYAGEQLKGFGQLILIKHQDDYVTAYAHNEQVLVKRGDIVRRGETIARVGTSGNVTTPQLHFEIRRGSQAIDPLPVMTQQAAN